MYHYLTINLTEVIGAAGWFSPHIWLKEVCLLSVLSYSFSTSFSLPLSVYVVACMSGRADQCGGGHRTFKTP